MARRIAYDEASLDAVITLADAAEQCRVEVEDLQGSLVERVILPGVIAQAEARTSAAIRVAVYEEDWPAGYPSGHALDVGQAREILSVSQVVDGVVTPLAVPTSLRQGRETYLDFPGGRPPGALRIRYRAGVDLDAYPAVRQWLLLYIGTAYEQREHLVVGSSLSELPGTYLDFMLADITVPPRF